ncbi:hypothetical protein CEXT_185201 [Caerostris extrusa]|uniref:Uncharacterized protein n=1 Tax=Caerostris extrusa TaxID=172846 RepID=A0AAV4W4S1_CAEEX|nr:hypothetical protein CEXT_185201 [Caerostris extrusa]
MDEQLNEFIENTSQTSINHTTVYLHVCDYESLRSSRRGKPRSKRSIFMEESVLDAVETISSTSIRGRCLFLRVSRCCAQRVLNAGVLARLSSSKESITAPSYRVLMCISHSGISNKLFEM